MPPNRLLKESASSEGVETRGSADTPVDEESTEATAPTGIGSASTPPSEIFAVVPL